MRISDWSSDLCSADLRSFTNDHAHAVIDEKAPPDARARMNLNASEPARQIRVEARQPLQLMRPQPVADAMPPDRMQARIARQHFPRTARGRVAIQNAGDIFLDAGAHEQRMGRRAEEGGV